MRHERAHGRTSTERGQLRISVDGARLVLGAGTEIAMTRDAIESFDASTTPPLLLVLRGETPLARYASIVEGQDPSPLFAERVIDRRDGRVSLELVPRAPWLGLERAVLRIVDEGPDAGRIERCLWLDGLGNWQRLDLEGLRHPTRLEATTLQLSPHPDARRVEL
ncbi:MAG: hypothetical protein K1X94_07030 [Sandaracinaceae bacterium]|nr:hypothetical protein [Sandaracinaceae bacterium]